MDVYSCYKKGVMFNSLRPHECNTNQSICGCKNVNSTKESNFWKWPNNIQFCGLRDSSMSFLNTYQNIYVDGGCKSGFKHCGNKMSPSKGICIPTKKECPITSVYLTQKDEVYDRDPKFKKIRLEETRLYYTRNEEFNPIVDLIVSEHHVCTSDSIRSITPGRTDYPLLAIKANSSCIHDQRYTELDSSAGEKTLLALNGVRYGGLPAFTTNNFFKWKRFSREMIQFSPECKNLVKKITGSYKSFMKIKYLLNVLYVSRITERINTENNCEKTSLN